MKYLTFTNNGCVKLCLNMLESAKKSGIETNDFYVACLDKMAYEKTKDYNSFLFTEQELTEFQDWSDSPNSNYRKLSSSKWKLIKEFSNEHSNFCWTDCDIAFIKNPTEILKNNPKTLFQMEYKSETICAGFMVFNNSQSCHEMIQHCSQRLMEDDQKVINNIAFSRYRRHIALLNPDLFPNGIAYYAEDRKNKKHLAYIVHNNWMVGLDTKINKFKEENLWFMQ